MDNAIPGFWRAQLSAEAALAASREYSQIQVDKFGHVYWVELCPDRSGHSFIYCQHAENQRIKQITPDDYSVYSRVHEYGGRSWCLAGETAIFVNASDQQIYQHPVTANLQPRQITHAENSRFIEPVYDAKRNRVICIEETHTNGNVENRIVAVDLEGGAIQSLCSGADFYAYPTLNSAADRFAYISWNHPEQPWTSSFCHVASLDADGAVIRQQCVAGNKYKESVSQTLFVGEQLYLISDRSGWWNIYAWHEESDLLTNLNPVRADVMSSPWQSGLMHYGISASNAEEVLCSIEIEHAGSKLKAGDKLLDLPFSYYRALHCIGHELFCVASSVDIESGVIGVDLLTGNYRVIRGCHRSVSLDDCSLPAALEFGSQNNKTYGYLYTPQNREYQLNDQEMPLVVFLHGGPTAATYPVFNAKIQFWTQRGFAVLDLNYSGSSNYGRNYRNRLKHQWGVIEIRDIEAAVESVCSDPCINTKAVFIRGNSSGGYSALNALSDLNCFAAGASLYGVTDPYVLSQHTHKFESHYLEWLIGSPDTDSVRYSERAPMNKVSGISCPVIFFQGEQDKVVLPEQTRRMVHQLQRQGNTVEAHYFADEAHGFKKAQNAQLVLEKELQFYQKQLLGKLASCVE